MRIQSDQCSDASLQDFRVYRSTLDARFITPVETDLPTRLKNIFA